MFDGNGGIIKLDVANLASSDQALVTPSSGTQPFSLEAWVYIPTGPSQTINIASKSALAGIYNYANSGWRLWAAGADLYFHVGYDARVVAYSALTAGSWNHIVATYNGSYGSFSTGAISMYVNAQAQTLSYNNGWYCYNTANVNYVIGSANSCNAFNANSNPIWIGGTATTDWNVGAMQGAIADFAFYGSALSAARVAAHYRASIVANTLPTMRVVPGNNAITLDWASPTNIGSAAVTSYRIQRRILGTAAWSDLIVNTNSAATSYIDYSTTNGTTYQYRVAAYNPAGQGTTFSNTGTATPYGTPGAVTGLTATPGAKQVTLSWSAPTGTATGGSPITGYEFSYTDISGNSSTPIVITTTTYTQNGLQPGATYKFKIRAINGYGYAVEPAGVATEIGRAHV